jgi:ABC-type polysaccharide/polyol phosphate transport system ATPase subunit
LPTLPDGAVRADHVWKRFRADGRQAKLRDELNYLRARLQGHGDDAWRWALRDVALEIGPGESVGLVGSNGSGKSTLLKLLCGVMYPYAGEVVARGRIGALIDVTSGIHPDLSGRENLFLYGSLLGLPRARVAARFDEIVAFAELGQAIDRQVKYYSTGMKMRLGFSVAAFLEPDILLVDEVLAVGDASFQQKCLERMRTVLNQGTTLVFVSHDLAAMEATCTRAVWLRDGLAVTEGPVRPVLAAYRRAVEEEAEAGVQRSDGIEVTKVEASGPDGGLPRSHDEFRVLIRLDSERAVDGTICLGVSEGPATPIFVLRRSVSLPVGEITWRCRVTDLPLPGGRFYVWLGIVGDDGQDLVAWYPARSFDVVGPALDLPPRAVARLAPVHVETAWELGC